VRREGVRRGAGRREAGRREAGRREAGRGVAAYNGFTKGRYYGDLPDKFAVGGVHRFNESDLCASVAAEVWILNPVSRVAGCRTF